MSCSKISGGTKEGKEKRDKPFKSSTLFDFGFTNRGYKTITDSIHKERIPRSETPYLTEQMEQNNACITAEQIKKEEYPKVLDGTMPYDEWKNKLIVAYRACKNENVCSEKDEELAKILGDMVKENTGSNVNKEVTGGAGGLSLKYFESMNRLNDWLENNLNITNCAKWFITKIWELFKENTLDVIRTKYETLVNLKHELKNISTEALDRQAEKYQDIGEALKDNISLLVTFQTIITRVDEDQINNDTAIYRFMIEAFNAIFAYSQQTIISITEHTMSAEKTLTPYINVLTDHVNELLRKYKTEILEHIPEAATPEDFQRWLNATTPVEKAKSFLYIISFMLLARTSIYNNSKYKSYPKRYGLLWDIFKKYS